MRYDNDGTNACAFLCVKIADVILSEVVTGIEFFVELAEAIEDTIWHLPEKINEHRDLPQNVRRTGSIRNSEETEGSDLSVRLL